MRHQTPIFSPANLLNFSNIRYNGRCKCVKPVIPIKYVQSVLHLRLTCSVQLKDIQTTSKTTFGRRVCGMKFRTGIMMTASNYYKELFKPTCISIRIIAQDKAAVNRISCNFHSLLKLFYNLFIILIFRTESRIWTFRKITKK